MRFTQRNILRSCFSPKSKDKNKYKLDFFHSAIYFLNFHFLLDFHYRNVKLTFPQRLFETKILCNINGIFTNYRELNPLS